MYGKNCCMKKTLHIDEKLLEEAKRACGSQTDTDTVRLGLEALIRTAAHQRLRALLGSEPGNFASREVPRRRERPARRPSKRRAA
jgi:Arc/MetJ family transcription regulator